MGSSPAEVVLAPVSLPISAAIPLDMALMPRAVPGVPSPAERPHLEGKERIEAERCLANAIYYEARSEPVRGHMAVAQVVINRAF
jgi:spore germination cell wall hydrolase CwlJ-like protein